MTLEQTLIQAALAAGKYLRENALNPPKVEWKKEEDPVTELDRHAEQLIKSILGQNYKMNFIGEEYDNEDNGYEITAHIDPLDGTKSYLRKEFRSTVSIGLAKGKELFAGAVYDFMRDLLYIGYKGKTYILHNNKIYDFPKRLDIPPRISLGLTGLNHLIKTNELQNYKISKPEGSIALGFVEIAINVSDALFSFEDKGNSWDIAAGVYIASISDCYISNKYGEKYNFINGKEGVIIIKNEFKDLLYDKLKLDKPK